MYLLQMTFNRVTNEKIQVECVAAPSFCLYVCVYISIGGGDMYSVDVMVSHSLAVTQTGSKHFYNLIATVFVSRTHL